MIFENFYKCPKCSAKWTSEDDSQCNDACGDCDISDIEPIASKRIHMTSQLPSYISDILQENPYLKISIEETPETPWLLDYILSKEPRSNGIWIDSPETMRLIAPK